METLTDQKFFSVISSQASFSKYEQQYWLGRIWKYQISCHKAEWSNSLTNKKKTHKYYFFSSQESKRDMWTGIRQKTLVLSRMISSLWEGVSHHHIGGPSRHMEQQHFKHLNKLLPANKDVPSSFLQCTMCHYIGHQNVIFLVFWLNLQFYAPRFLQYN